MAAGHPERGLSSLCGGSLTGWGDAQTNSSHPLSPVILSGPRWRGGGGDRGIGGGEAEEALRCPHRAWLLCSSISQRALPASRERLNEARAV